MVHSASTSNPRSSEIPAVISNCSDDHNDASMDSDGVSDGYDYSSNLPDECLACVFQWLPPSDRMRCSAVCRRWLRIEGHSRHFLLLNAQSGLSNMLPKLFFRFDTVTILALKCDHKSVSIGDEALILISLKWKNLTRLRLRSCHELTDDGMTVCAQNCKNLKKFSCGSCNFGVKGMNALLENCEFLEELSLKRLRGITNGAAAEVVGAGKAANSLRVICLEDLYDGHWVAPVILGAKNLRCLKLLRCSGDWDKLLEVIADKGCGLLEVHLEMLQISDLGLSAISNCVNLEIFHLVKIPSCTNVGLVTIAEKCRLLRELRIDGWKTKGLNDNGLIAIANHCPNLQKLVLINVNLTHLSLEKLATKCQILERLALCGIKTVGDAVVSWIAMKCNALKKLSIKRCPVSDQGLEALACGCPNLVKLKLKKCKGVSYEGADWLRASRSSLAVKLDAFELESADSNTSFHETGGIEIQQMVGRNNNIDNVVSSS